jgi:hypothetical protein
MAFTPHLEDWEIAIDRQGVEQIAFGMTDNPFQDTEATTFGFNFTNSSAGGCGTAKLNLMGQSASFVAGLDLKPDDRLLIRLQCGDESSLKDRYVGAIKQLDMGWGTEPQVRKIQAAGIFGQFRKIPIFAFYDDKTIAELVIAVLGDLASRSDITNYSSYVTYGTDYTVALTDFMDQYADRALKRLVKLAGADCVWGVVPGDSGTPTDARFYFQQLGETAEDLGFEVGVNVEDATGKLSRLGHLNGMLVSCQRKIGGGDLWMYVPPPDGTIPYRIGKVRIAELVEPTDAYHYAQTVVEGFPDETKEITFTVPGFGEQIWANEIMNTPLAVALENGGTDFEVKCKSYTLSVDGDGSVDTKFALSALPDMHLASLFGDLLRDVIVSETREFWSGAELAARDSDVIRGWRRHAGQTYDIRNFWAANLDNIESIVTDDDWADGGYDEPATFPDYGWDYDSDHQRVTGSDASGTIATFPIPTGLTAGAAIVYLKTAGASYNQIDSQHWVRNENTVPNATWAWWNDWWGNRPHLLSLPSNTWRMAVTCAYMFVSGVPESPIKVWIGPMEELGDTTVPATYGGMKTLGHYYDIIFAASTTDPTTASGFCLRLHRNGLSALTGDVSCALGWVSAGTFHSNWWDAGAMPDSQVVGTITLGTDASGVTGTHSFELDVWLPTSGGSGEFRVRARKDRTAEVLWDSSTIHGDGEVSGSAPDPAGGYYAMCAYYAAEGQVQNDYTCGLKNIDIKSPGGINVAVTRDGEYWTIGNPEVLLPLLGDTYLDGEKQLMFAVNLGEGNSLSSWAVGFTHETPEVNLAWDQNFGDTGSGDGEFFTPRDCTVDSGYIYIVESGNHRVQILTNTDPPVYSAKFGSEGSADGEFDNPSGIAHDDTYLYVADTVNARISIFLKASPYTFIRHIGVGTLTNPNNLTVERGTYSSEGLVYVLNSSNDTVYIIKKDGTNVDSFTPFTDLPSGDIAMTSIAISGDEDHLYITNMGNNTLLSLSNCIRKFKRTSPYTQIWTWGARGQNPPTGLWEYPYSVCQLGDLLFVGSGSNVTTTRNYVTTLADRGSYAEYLDHIDGSGGESGKGIGQAGGCDIRDNIVYLCELFYDQVKRYIVS